MQHFERAEPNQLWQSDLFTFLLRRHERIYVAAFLDDHSRYLVSLAMAHHQRSVLVLEALSRGIAEYGAPREILTDQGRQYTAWRGSTEFEAELKRHGIAHVKSRPHHPQTCGKIERFWKTLWEELLVAHGVRRLRGLPAAGGALHPALQLPASPSGAEGLDACGPVLPRGEPGAREHRGASGAERAAPGATAAAEEAVLPGGPVGRSGACHQRERRGAERAGGR